ncbi:MAG: hypothetical protein ABH828_00245 [archaeon]
MMEGLVGDIYLALAVQLLFTIAFGHSLEKSLEKHHFLSYMIGFILATIPTTIMFLLFMNLEILFNIESFLFYFVTYIVFFFVAIRRTHHHRKEKRKKVL